MNCEVNYEDPTEDDEVSSIPGPKTVSWKKDITSSFKSRHRRSVLGRIRIYSLSGRWTEDRGELSIHGECVGGALES